MVRKNRKKRVWVPCEKKKGGGGGTKNTKQKGFSPGGGQTRIGEPHHRFFFELPGVGGLGGVVLKNEGGMVPKKKKKRAPVNIGGATVPT